MEQRILIVLGTHRAAVSLLGSALERAGAQAGSGSEPRRPRDEDAAVPRERRELGDFHDRLLRALDLREDSLLPAAPDALSAERFASFRHEMRSLLDGASASRALRVWTDPRAALVLDLWGEVLRETAAAPGFVLMVQDPRDFCSATSRADGFGVDKSSGIWWHHHLAALSAAPEVPMVLVDEPRFLADPAGQFRACARMLGLPDSLEAPAVPGTPVARSPGARDPGTIPERVRELHGRISRDEPHKRDAELIAWARERYDDLQFHGAILREDVAPTLAQVRDLTARARTADVLRESLEHARGIIAGVESSRSWRITAPMRKIARILQGVRERRMRVEAPDAPSLQDPRREPVDPARRPDVAFVLCVEPGPLEEQTLLFIESLRSHGGRFRDCAVHAYSPRAGRSIGAETRARLEALGAHYCDLALNTWAVEYGSVNKLVAGAHLEEHGKYEQIVVVDSDTIFLREPVELDLPEGVDVGVRPEDVQGISSTGAGDLKDRYWRELCRVADVDYDRLPWVESFVDRVRIKAHYNAGLFVVRARERILARSCEIYSLSLRHRLTPRDDVPPFRTGTGWVEQTARNLWGSKQAALVAAIWSTDRSVRHLSSTYNYSLHLHASIDPAVAAAVFPSAVHVHYHWLLERDARVTNPLFLPGSPLSEDQKRWLLHRTRDW